MQYNNLDDLRQAIAALRASSPTLAEPDPEDPHRDKEYDSYLNSLQDSNREEIEREARELGIL